MSSPHHFSFTAQHSVSTVSFQQEYPLLSATASSVWSCGRTEPAHSQRGGCPRSGTERQLPQRGLAQHERRDGRVLPRRQCQSFYNDRRRRPRQCLEAQQLQSMEFVDRIIEIPVSTQSQTQVIRTLSALPQLQDTDDPDLSRIEQVNQAQVEQVPQPQAV